ncbi:MAG: hypothetical protein JW904_03565 [Spirochaetales bacterium]|nr:hypothetical protein [Spirochaetales bacterium]
MKIPGETQQWLLESDIPYVRYNAARLFKPGSEDAADLAKDPFIKENISCLKSWSSEILKQHNRPDLLMHRLAMLADLGVTKDHPGMKAVIDTILKQTTPEGIPLTMIQIPKVFGGTDIPALDWILCDFPLILYALLKMRVKNQKIDEAVRKFQELVDENGFRCKGSIPKFKGPGRREDMCPIVNVFAARVFSASESLMKSKAASFAVEALLSHWEKQKEKKYFMFGIGTDFKKLKFPLVWYNILHVLEPLSHFKGLRKDSRFLEMIDVLVSKADDVMRFTPESMYTIFKGRDFANKKEPSMTVTLFALRIVKRAGM